MTSHDAYILLGLSPNCSADEIAKAYRKKALVHHPDKGGDARKFQAITSAKELLLKVKSSPSSNGQQSSGSTTFTFKGRTYKSQSDFFNEFLRDYQKQNATSAAEFKARQEKRARENAEFLFRAKVLVARVILFGVFVLKVALFHVLGISGGIQAIVSVIILVALIKMMPQILKFIKDPIQQIRSFSFRKYVWNPVKNLSKKRYFKFSKK